MPPYHSASGSVAEDLFIELFSEAFGAEKAGYLYSQYHFYDIYQNSRYAAYGGGEWPLVRRSVAAVRPEWPP